MTNTATRARGAAIIGSLVVNPALNVVRADGINTTGEAGTPRRKRATLDGASRKTRAPRAGRFRNNHKGETPVKELRADIAKIESALTAQEHQLEACRERKKRVERQYEEKQKIVNGLRDLLNRKRKELVRLSENDNAEHDNGGS